MRATYIGALALVALTSACGKNEAPPAPAAPLQPETVVSPTPADAAAAPVADTTPDITANVTADIRADVTADVATDVTVDVAALATAEVAAPEVVFPNVRDGVVAKCLLRDRAAAGTPDMLAQVGRCAGEAEVASDRCRVGGGIYATHPDGRVAYGTDSLLPNDTLDFWFDVAIAPLADPATRVDVLHEDQSTPSRLAFWKWAGGLGHDGWVAAKHLVRGGSGAQFRSNFSPHQQLVVLEAPLRDWMIVADPVEVANNDTATFTLVSPDNQSSWPLGVMKASLDARCTDARRATCFDYLYPDVLDVVLGADGKSLIGLVAMSSVVGPGAGPQQLRVWPLPDDVRAWQPKALPPEPPPAPPTPPADPDAAPWGAELDALCGSLGFGETFRDCKVSRTVKHAGAFSAAAVVDVLLRHDPCSHVVEFGEGGDETHSYLVLRVDGKWHIGPALDMDTSVLDDAHGSATHTIARFDVVAAADVGTALVVDVKQQCPSPADTLRARVTFLCAVVAGTPRCTSIATGKSITPDPRWPENDVKESHWSRAIKVAASGVTLGAGVDPDKGSYTFAQLFAAVPGEEARLPGP